LTGEQQQTMLSSIQFSSLSEFISMGGYAFNVWSVYALFSLFFFINLFYPLLRKKQILQEQKRRLLVNQEMGGTNPGSSKQSGTD